MKTYTLGEIARLGLLKNHEGKPYKHKATISNILRGQKRVFTPHGLGYAIPESAITKLNRRWK
jgi:hypothetical protein